MQLFHRLLLHVALVMSLLILLYAFMNAAPHMQNGEEKTAVTIKTNSETAVAHNHGHMDQVLSSNHTGGHSVQRGKTKKSLPEVMHMWCILTKVQAQPGLRKKFETFAESLVKTVTSPEYFVLHVVTDELGQDFVTEMLDDLESTTGHTLKVEFHMFSNFAERLKDLVTAMQPYFSSSPGSYYSDALFFLSLGLHKVAPGWMQRCIMVDIDTKFMTDPRHLWHEFDNFLSAQIVGLAPELSPVYKHALHTYRSKLMPLNSKVGEPHSAGGYSGLNSGVILLHLQRIRKSKLYSDLCEASTVKILAKKYSFKGHLGDQDFYTLLGIERPELVHSLPCTWNRQLCTWWRDHGYRDVFDTFFSCKGKINLYHGNCNTPIPVV